jgi:hypothetical protein
LPEKSKLAQHAYEESQKNMLEWSEGLADWAKNHIQEIQGISPHVSDGPSDQLTQFEHLSHLDLRYHSRSEGTTIPLSVVCFSCVGTIRSIVSLQWWFLLRYFSGARPRACGVLII